IGEHADRDGDVSRTLGCFPQHHATAIRAEVVRHFAVLDLAAICLVFAADLHTISRIPRAEPERRSGTALAVRTVAQRDDQRLAIRFGTKLSAGTMGSPFGHGAMMD